MDAKDMLTVQQAAGLLGVHQNSVYQAIHEGRLPTAEVFGRKVIQRTDVEAYTTRVRVTGEKPKGRPKGRTNRKTEASRELKAGGHDSD